MFASVTSCVSACAVKSWWPKEWNYKKFPFWIRALHCSPNVHVNILNILSSVCFTGLDGLIWIYFTGSSQQLVFFFFFSCFWLNVRPVFSYTFVVQWHSISANWIKMSVLHYLIIIMLIIIRIRIRRRIQFWSLMVYSSKLQQLYSFFILYRCT